MEKDDPNLCLWSHPAYDAGEFVHDLECLVAEQQWSYQIDLVEQGLWSTSEGIWQNRKDAMTY